MVDAIERGPGRVRFLTLVVVLCVLAGLMGFGYAGTSGPEMCGGTDTTPPTVPSGLDLSKYSDTGSSNSDNYTSQACALSFSWCASCDSGSGVAGYEWKLDDGAWQWTTCTTISLNTTDGAHVLYVRAKDRSGNYSAARSLAFTVDTAGPYAPALTAPANNTTPSVNSVPLSWQWGGDRAPVVDLGAWKYNVQVATDPSFASGTVVKDSTTTGTTATVSTCWNRAYYWRVRSCDKAGNWGDWSAVWCFTSKALACTFTAPLTGGWFGSNVQVSATTSDDSRVQYVEFQYSLDGVNWYALPGLSSANGRDTNGADGWSLDFQTTNTPQSGTLNGTVWVRARACSLTGSFSAWSVGNPPMRIDNSKPANPTTITSATPTNTWTSDNNVTVSWSGATDGLSGVAGYSYVWTNDAATSPDGTIDTTDTSATQPLTDGIWYLNVRTIDATGNAADGFVTYGPIMIDRTAPANPLTCTETHGVASGVSQLGVNEPAFTWTPGTDATSGVNGYYVYWGTDPNGTSTNYTTDTTFAPPMVTEPGTYYLRIATRDNAGNVSGWTTIFIFILGATNDYYVNDGVTGEAGSLCSAPGNDANSGLSPSAPMRTIQALLNKYPTLGAGKIVRVDAGTYAENVVVGATHSGLTIQGVGADKSVVDGGQVASVFVFNGMTSGQISGLTIRNGWAHSTPYPGSTGGGIRCDGSSIVICNNIITGNKAGDISAGTGAGGGIYTRYGSCTIYSNVIANNVAFPGGGIRSASATPTIYNNTIVGNLNDGVSYYISGTKPIVNCILWNNGDDLSGCTAQYSCIQDGDAGTGNFSTDPLFVNAAGGDYRLSVGSPCVDAANGTIAPATDFDGNARQDDPGAANVGVGPVWADVGAFEFLGSSPLPFAFYVNDGSIAEADSVCTVAGDDANDGLSPRSPMRTIQALLNKYPSIGAGVTVNADPGLYTENVVVAATHSGLTLKGAGAGKSVVDGGAVATVFAFNGVTSGEISGFTIQNGWAHSTPYPGSTGGGIRCDGASIVIRNNVITGNRAGDLAAGTGAGGGIYTRFGACEIYNNVITNNVAFPGGGIRCASANPTIYSNTIVGNFANGVSYYLSGLKPIVNCIVWDNSDDLSGCTAQYSCIQNGDAGVGNTAADPLFVNAAAGDYRLSAGSPCVNTGSAASAPATDLDDVPRDSTPDMGAYERASGG